MLARAIVLLIALAEGVGCAAALAGPPPRPYTASHGGGGGRGPASRGSSPASRGSGRGGRGSRKEKGADFEANRQLDLFGEPGEWKARKRADHLREWRSRSEAVADGIAPVGGAEAAGGRRSSSSSMYRGPPAAKVFEPKVWSTEAGGGRPPAFFAKDASSFVAVGASDELQAALAASGITKPSHVQAVGFKPILRGEDVALADQTGSGKTIAYLAPLVQSLRDAERVSGRTPAGHVRAVVLTPTSELAQQVLGVAKRIAAAGVPFRSSIITGEHKWRTQAETAAAGIELLICTPGRLRAHLTAEKDGVLTPSFSLASTTHVVLDEADLLLEDADFEATWRLLRAALPDRAATAFVTATLPDWLITRVQKDLPLTKVR